MIQEKKNAGYEGEADQHKNCRKKFSNAHMIRNGYIYTDRVLIDYSQGTAPPIA